ncbi:MAG: hypothetical protein EOO41_05720, partial [Methanobacteriota archaeon]
SMSMASHTSGGGSEGAESGGPRQRRASRAMSSATACNEGVMIFSAPMGGGSNSSAPTLQPGVPRVRIAIAIHKPPADPQPSAIYLHVGEAKNLLPVPGSKRAAMGLNVRVTPMARAKEPLLGSRDSRAIELRTSLVPTASDVTWNEAVLLVDEAQPTLGVKDVQFGPSPTPAPLVATQMLHMSALRFLQLTVRAGDDQGKDGVLGEAVVSVSDCFADEDTVIGHRSLHMEKWLRLRPSRSMDPKLEGSLGHVRVGITMRFDVPLLQPGWLEAIDAASGATYFHNLETRTSQWTEPGAALHTSSSARAGAAASPVPSSGGGSGSAASPAASAAYRRQSVDIY